MFSIQCVIIATPAEQDFLSLPPRLYPRNRLTQDRPTETQLIAGTHPLSHTFAFQPYVVYRDGAPAARFALTLYPDRTLYLGYFECEHDDALAAFVFARVDELVQARQIKRLIGPVDASFWIKYRFKSSHFDRRPYTFEPYNLAYYPDYFQRHGFTVTDRYISTYHRDFLPKLRYREFTERYKQFKRRDYQIVGINRDNFEQSMRDIYVMLMELYADFPVFTPISLADFHRLFYSMQFISTQQFAKVAYYHGEPAGFVITLPNYNNLLTSSSRLARLRIALRRIRAPQYVMLYMGVRPQHHGLSRALIKATVTGLYLRLSPLIGALIHTGKSTAEIAPETISDTFEYVLMAKDYE